MLKRFAQTLALILLASYLFSYAAIAQTRRSKPRRTRSTGQRAANNVQPLTQSDKAWIANLIEQGKMVEYQYNYSPDSFGDSARDLFNKCQQDVLQDGNVKTFLLNVCQEYYDAGHVYAIVTGRGNWGESEQATQEAQRVSNTYLRNRGESTRVYIDYSLLEIVQRYGLQRATPYQAIISILNRASKDREFLTGLVLAAPIIPEPPEPQTTAPTPRPEYTPISNTLIGTWLLQVTMPDTNRNVPVKLKIKQLDSELDCVVGDSESYKPCRIIGASFNFTFITNWHNEAGQNLDVNFLGSVEGDSIKGDMMFTSINGQTVFAPFIGTRMKR
jgi:hypothetical protein